MFKFTKKYNDFIPSGEERKIIKKSLTDVMNGNILTKKAFTRELPFLMLLAGLGLIYIANGYYYTKTYRKMVALEKEVKELRIESLTLASDFMKMSKQSEVIKQMRKENLNLEEAVTPPYKIYLKKDGE